MTYHTTKRQNKTNKGNLYFYTYIRVWRGLNWRRLLWFSFTCLFLDFSLDFLCSINCMRFLFLNLGLFLFVKLFRYIYCLFLNKNINFCVLSYWLLFFKFYIHGCSPYVLCHNNKLLYMAIYPKYVLLIRVPLTLMVSYQ